MKKILLFALAATMTFAITSCSDDEDDEPMETSKSQVAQEFCDRLKTCNEDLYNTAGGDADCVTEVEGAVVGDADCPDADYDAVLATQCVEEALALSCSEFEADATSLYFGQPTTYMPDACDAMCGAM